MIKGFHHAALSTPDLERCIDFYTRIIGGKVAWTFGWPIGTEEAEEVIGVPNSAANAAMLKIGNSFLEVFEFSSPEQSNRMQRNSVHDYGITHVCLEVTNIEDEFKRLSEAGMKFKSEPKAQDGSIMVYGHDPDGNVVELIEFLEN